MGFALVSFIELLDKHVPSGAIVEILKDRKFQKFKDNSNSQDDKLELYDKVLKFLRDYASDEVATICGETLDGKTTTMDQLTEEIKSDRSSTPMRSTEPTPIQSSRKRGRPSTRKTSEG
jgi:hypothetical protein